jgi:hypothetical protein
MSDGAHEEPEVKAGNSNRAESPKTAAPFRPLLLAVALTVDASPRTRPTPSMQCKQSVWALRTNEARRPSPLTRAASQQQPAIPTGQRFVCYSIIPYQSASVQFHAILICFSFL